MNTTGPVMTVTDELLAELAQELNRCKFSDDDDGDESWPSISGEAVSALISELRRLRAENAELAQSLAESRANDQAAMGWLTSLRWASGDRGERMLPELVTHVEGLANDAVRLEWMVAEGAVIARMNGTGRPMCYQVSFPFESCQQLDWFPSWREAVDDIMATK